MEMATKTKNHTQKRPPKAKPPTRKAGPAQPAGKAVRSAKKGRTAAHGAGAREAERERLLQEERSLERDVENDEEPSALSESAEYIPGVAEDSLAEELGEAAVTSATSGDQAAENIRDEDLSEEEGGPFVITPARREFAPGTDESNPADAEPAPFPTATSRPK
jgi:hypothetical protein